MDEASLLLLNQKQNDRARAWDAMNALRGAIGEKQPTAEQRAQWQKIEGEIVTLGAEISTLGSGLASTRIDPVLGGGGGGYDGRSNEARSEVAFREYLRRGPAGLEPSDRAFLTEKRAQGEGTSTAGGYLVPQGFWLRITETLKAYGGLLSIANVLRTSTGNPLPWPSNNDTANVGHLLGENVQVTETDLVFGTKQLNGWTYTSDAVLVSLQLAQDSAFDFDTFLPRKLGMRVGRGIAADFINGSGTARPSGLLTTIRTGVTGATGQTASVTYANLVDVEHSVDAAYRQMGNCRWLMNDATLGSVRKIADSNGRPLWTPGYGSFDQANPESILGYPVQVDNSMPTMAANAKSIAFGDFEQGYVVREVLDPVIMRLVERYADFGQIGYILFARYDGTVDDGAAVAAYVNSAT